MKTKTVNVAEYRDRISHLERIINYDRQMCVGDKEKAHWLRIMTKVYSELSLTDCKRAKVEDRERRENIINKAATYFVESNVISISERRKIS